MNKTKVCFRIDKTGEITAVFIEELGTLKLDFVCYAHLGQHSAACPLWVYNNTRPAKPKQYAPLKRELENIIGYDLDIINKLPSFSKSIETLKLEREKLK